MNRNVIVFLVVVLAVLHQDVWYWDDPRLVLGFLPVGLAYHAAYSVMCGIVWALAVRFAWPDELEAFATGGEEPSGPKDVP